METLSLEKPTINKKTLQYYHGKKRKKFFLERAKESERQRDRQRKNKNERKKRLTINYHKSTFINFTIKY